ncbi:hypothetical protein EH220_02020 [bacterium]|nr:MAG: hypothetical protein EH220_02020 [bacterium]
MALMRPGRFDRQVVVDPPNVDGREQILHVHAKGKKVAKNINWRLLAARTPGFVGADLANAINEAALLAARKGKKEIEMADLEEAIDREMTGLERRSRVLKPKVKEKIAYHECGHALVGARLEHTDPIHRVSIIPRGVATLGHTLYLPTEDRYLVTRAEIIDKITAALGGRAAEEVIYGEVTSGAYSDLQQVTGMARSMVMDYGMSSKLGQVVYRTRSHGNREMPFQTQDDLYGEKTAQAIDEEVKQIVDDCYTKALEILRNEIDNLRAMTMKLLEVEVMEGEALVEFLGREAITDFSEELKAGQNTPTEENSTDSESGSTNDEEDIGRKIDSTG